MEDMYFNFLTIDPTTIIGVLCNTLILFLVFKKLLFERVKKILDARKEEVSKTYREAESAKNSAESMKTEYTEKLAAAKEKSAEITREAAARASRHADEIVAEAKKEAANITAKANADIEAEKKRAAIAVRAEISDIASAVAEKIVSREISSDEEQDRLIDSFISELGDVK